MDTTIYTLFKGKMTKLAEPRNPDHVNFVITCDFGDWSGFRTLKECERRFPELEAMAAADQRSNFYYNVVER